MSTKTPDLFETDPDIINIAANLEFIIKVDKKILPKVGTILLFGTNPNKFFPSCKVQAVKFKGLDLTAPISTRQLFEGTLPNLIRSSRKFLEGVTSTASVFLSDSKDRVDYVEYPFWAVREALSNAIFHRDYSETGREIDIRVFDDRIEIMSPGGLGGGLTVDDLGTGKRYIRNLFIADVLTDLKFIERAGTGIMRMRKEMDANGCRKPD